jgi:hypothetical protein
MSKVIFIIVCNHTNRPKKKLTYLTPPHGVFKPAEQKNKQYLHDIVQYIYRNKVWVCLKLQKNLTWNGGPFTWGCELPSTSVPCCKSTAILQAIGPTPSLTTLYSAPLIPYTHMWPNFLTSRRWHRHIWILLGPIQSWCKAFLTNMLKIFKLYMLYIIMFYYNTCVHWVYVAMQYKSFT